MQSGRQQTRLLFGEDIGDSAMIASRPAPLMRHLIAPQQSLAIAFGQCGEGAARPERIAHIADGSFHASFLIACAHLARAWREVIVRAKLQQSRMKQNLIAAPFQHGALEVVVKNHTRLAGPGFKRMHVTAQEVLHRLIEEELQIQSARIGKRHHEAGQSPLGAAHHHVAEVRPVHLCLLSGKGVQFQERLADLRTQPAHGAAQLHDAASVTAIAHHHVDARGTQARMSFQRVANELDVGIDDGGPQRLHTFEPLALDSVAHGIGMDVQFAGDGADLPMLGIKIAANLGAGFGSDHDRDSPSSWHAWKRIDEAPSPAADPAPQPQNGLLRMILLRLGRSTLE